MAVHADACRILSRYSSRAYSGGGRGGGHTGLRPVLLQLDLHRRHQRPAGADHRHARRVWLLALRRSRGNHTYLFIILTTRMLPAIVVIIPIFLMFPGRRPGRHLSRHHPALHRVQPAPSRIWMMKSFFDELSPEVEDAARLDGSSDTRVFFKIRLPQVVAGLAADRGVRPDPDLERDTSSRCLLAGVRDAHGAGRHGADHRRRHRRPLGSARGDRDAVPDPVILVTVLPQTPSALRGVTFGTIKQSAGRRSCRPSN